MKYDFVINGTDNIYADALAYANTNTNGILVYAMVLMFFGVLLFVYLSRTNDVLLSWLYALFASTIVSIIFYYLGVFMGVSLFSGAVLLFMLLMVVVGFGIIKFGRNPIND